MICHFLIGIPGSGKTTFAVELAKLGNYRIVSTDAIRQQLYGDASIQGEWSQIEEKVISETVDAIAEGNSVIYDATNAKRAWRIDLLLKLKLKLSRTSPVLWMAWYLQTPLATCKVWNQQRTRQVPEVIIENMHQSLQQFGPVATEGFAAVKEIDVTSTNFDIQQISIEIQQLPRTLINRANRNCHITLHSYSKLLDFERLMYLISLIIQYPGIGNLQNTNPSLLKNLFGSIPQFPSAVEEITALMRKLYGTVYGELQAIASDLDWLQQNSIIGFNSITPSSPIIPSPDQSVTPSDFVAHAYSDFDTFARLVQTIRFILYHPFLLTSGKGSLQTLVSTLRENGIINSDGLDTVRKDIEKVLKPYKILPEFPLRDGYFAGTAILSVYELTKIFDVLQSQAKSLDDPVALEIYQTFATRMLKSKLGVSNVYPVRAIANRSMIDPEFLPPDALSRNLPQLEEAIVNGQLLELNRFSGGGKFVLDEESFFLAFPLQIVFCNQAWYLGFECQGGKYAGLFRFERLDRLFVGQFQVRFRSQQEQEKSLQKLQKLSAASAGIFLGYSANDQRKFLSNDKQERSQVCITVELWFNDFIFRFITEGTKRFPAKQMKMSPPVEGGKLMLPKSIFCLKKTTDKQFPNRFQAVLPIWYLGDVEFLRWIVGFGGNVKVVQPEELVAKVKGIGEAILKVYEQ
ncbi:WYL domain-containing protein [Nostoc sp. UCD120]|uniref:WYL domain-containing protein n=1 Tax=Nostoc sp. UCD120 TaxID=2681312 RepID=UPI0016239FB0|nr:WYL domain-containing protein [Nostoc sp. UCD120]MBC1222434.1 WYL domain-containing protein [Nostoc sp. UCD120]